ncbi:Protein ZBED8 [Eumeta japonica]|uniref:Protein ZBED8 n=1 Tax=Eumeta variegata TaxID=151549 RepID=A0A4C1UMR2_EUMVA|nr:Protein ZBED8 [Eumeta japonica]
MSKKRKYDQSHVNLGFTFKTERDGTQKPKCFLSDSIGDFRTKRARFEKASTLTKLGFTPTRKPCLEASYKVGSICPDGASAMLVNKSGFAAYQR